MHNPAHTHTLSLSYSLSLSSRHPHTHSLSLSSRHPHTLSLSLSSRHPHTHTHTYTHTRLADRPHEAMTHPVRTYYRTLAALQPCTALPVSHTSLPRPTRPRISATCISVSSARQHILSAAIALAPPPPPLPPHLLRAPCPHPLCSYGPLLRPSLSASLMLPGSFRWLLRELGEGGVACKHTAQARRREGPHRSAWVQASPFKTPLTTASVSPSSATPHTDTAGLALSACTCSHPPPQGSAASMPTRRRYKQAGGRSDRGRCGGRGCAGGPAR